MKHFRHVLWTLVCILGATCGPASAASFPCSKAQSKVEKVICADAELSSLDEHLARYYGAAREALREAQSCLVADQRAWIRKSRDACQGAACLKKVYLERLAELDALQPGVSALRNIELPRRPPLVWMLAPALDEVAAPRNVPTRPLTVQGQLLNKVAGGDGFVIKTPSGAKHLVMGLMFLEGRAQDAMTSLVQTPGARYEVRGETDAAASGDPTPAFAPSRCAAIYRISP